MGRGVIILLHIQQTCYNILQLTVNTHKHFQAITLQIAIVKIPCLQEAIFV